MNTRQLSRPLITVCLLAAPAAMADICWIPFARPGVEAASLPQSVVALERAKGAGSSSCFDSATECVNAVFTGANRTMEDSCGKYCSHYQQCDSVCKAPPMQKFGFDCPPGACAHCGEACLYWKYVPEVQPAPFDCTEPANPRAGHYDEWGNLVPATIAGCGAKRSVVTDGVEFPLNDPPNTTYVSCIAWKSCPPGVKAFYNPYTNQYECPRRNVDVYTRPDVCPATGDFSPLSGLMEQPVNTGMMLLGEELTLDYDTAASPAGSPPLPGAGDVSDVWFTSASRRLSIAGSTVTAVRGSGEMLTFNSLDAGAWDTRARGGDELVRVANGWLYRSQRSQTLESYDPGGRLTGWTTREGQRVAVTSQSPLTTSMRDESGTGVDFTYRQSGGRTVLDSIATHDGAQRLQLSYDGRNNLTGIAWNDGARRRFTYDDPMVRWGLTQVIDENDAGFARFTYAPDGRVTSSERAGGTQRHSVRYADAPRPYTREVYDQATETVYRYHEWRVPEGTTVDSPAGGSSTFTAVAVAGEVRPTGVTQPAGAGCGPASRHVTYDADGNPRSRDDFNGHRVCTRYDAARNVESARVEGLAAGTDCDPLLAPGAALPAGSRKVTTEWHPDWNVEARRAEPGKLTTFVYNGQPDPTSGGAIAACAPPTALLPDGKPIAVLCRHVVQATLDTNGSQGFSAALAASPARQLSYTYDASGRRLTEDGPRTDVQDVTTWEYYTASNAAGVARPGDLKSVTDAVGKVTRFTRYDGQGRLLESVAPNGLVTSYTYDARGRRLTTAVGSLLFTTTYDAAGQPTRVTRPDGSWTSYAYDAAHRLVRTSDSLGNSVTYTLDDSGNVTAETLTDSVGSVKKQASWIYDALGRVRRFILGLRPGEGGAGGGAGGGAAGGATAGGATAGGATAGGATAGGATAGGATAGGATAGGATAGGATAGGATAGGATAPSCSGSSGDRRAQVCQRWSCDRQDLSEGTWTGAAPQCATGDMPATRANALKLINLYRFLADLPPVTTSAMRDSGAQECALMMHANNSISFSPPSSWACYTPAGASAASQSTMCWGASAVRCIDLSMADFGQANGNTLGSRRWLLSNSLGPVGIGSTPTFSCQWVIGGSSNAGKPWVAWPPPGPVPLGAINIPGQQSVDRAGWTVQGYSANVSGATVTVTDNGVSLPVTVTNLLANYGSPSAIKFIPNGWVTQAGHTYQVTITGGSLAAPISYAVEVVACP